MRRFLSGLIAVLFLSWVDGRGVAGAQPLESSAKPASTQQVLVMLRIAPEHFRPESGYGGSYGDAAGRSARFREAQRLAKAQGASLDDEWPMPSLSVDCFVLTLPASRSPDVAIAALNKDSAVSWSEPLQLFRGRGGPPEGDPLYRLQPVAREWRLSELHQFATGRGVKVAVIDSEIDRSHVDLRGAVSLDQNFVTGRGEVPETHGTAVAGVIAAREGNGVGMVGVAPGASLLGLRACWQEAPRAATSAPPATLCDTLSLAKALEFAVGHGAQVVNMSLAGPDDLLLAKLIDVALTRKMVVVAAYDRGLPAGGFPASHRGVVAVSDEAPPRVTGVASAPGRDIPTTEPGGRWGFVNGSSFSAAHVSGLYALMREREGRFHSALSLVASGQGATIDACATLLPRQGSADCSRQKPDALAARRAAP